jgi:hypothetical protein
LVFQPSSEANFKSSLQTLLIPIDDFLFILVEEFYGTRYQSGSFSLIKVEYGFHCLRSLLEFYYLFEEVQTLYTHFLSLQINPLLYMYQAPHGYRVCVPHFKCTFDPYLSYALFGTSMCGAAYC